MSESERFKWEAYPFRIDSFGNWLSFGYPIVGGWLPYLAFKTSSMTAKNSSSYETISYLLAEWFIRGYAVVYKTKESE